MIKWFAFLIALAVFATSTVPAQAAQGKKPPRTPEQVFKRLDKNHDGTLTLTELVGKKTGEKAVKAETIFKRLDRDGNASVSLAEFKAHKPRKKKPKSP
jgi:Ca2+-binding EF-hand superfamily protein